MSGLSFETKSKLESAKLKAEIAWRVQKAQAPLDAMIMADSNYFCPIKTGKLQQSAITNTQIGTGEIVWRTPYARRQYYDYHRPAYQPNPNATGKWFEAAKARWIDKWVALVDEYIKRG